MARGESQYNKFIPEPWQLRALEDLSPVLLLTGSVGGGKSRAAAEKIHALAMRYPGVIVLAIRKKEKDAIKSIKTMMSTSVIGYGGMGVTWRSRESRFEYANGSSIILAGIKGESEREGLRSIGDAQ